MKQIKKTMIALALLAFTGFAGAQNKSHLPVVSQHQRVMNMSPGERGSFEAEKMAVKLGLSADQKQSWQVAATERATANQPLKEKLRGSTTPVERLKLKAEMQQNNQAFDKKVDSFLNDEQKQKLAAEKQKMQEVRKQQRGGHGHHGKGNK